MNRQIDGDHFERMQFIDIIYRGLFRIIMRRLGICWIHKQYVEVDAIGHIWKLFSLAETVSYDLSCAHGINIPDSKDHGANMGSIWGRQDQGGPHVGPIWDML